MLEINILANYERNLLDEIEMLQRIIRTLRSERSHLQVALDHMRQLNDDYYQVNDYKSPPIDLMLSLCKTGECPECSIVCCPGNHPLHFHHDGCPYCSLPEDERDDGYALKDGPEDTSPYPGYTLGGSDSKAY